MNGLCDVQRGNRATYMGWRPLRPCLVIGYSGMDEDIRLALQKARSVRPVCWLCYKPKDIREITRLWKIYEGLPPLVLIEGGLRKLLKLLCLETVIELTEHGSRKKFNKSRFQKKLDQ